MHKTATYTQCSDDTDSPPVFQLVTHPTIFWTSGTTVSFIAFLSTVDTVFQNGHSLSMQYRCHATKKSGEVHIQNILFVHQLNTEKYRVSLVHHIPIVSVLQEKVKTCWDNLFLTYRKRAHFLYPCCVEYTYNSPNMATTHCKSPNVFRFMRRLILVDFFKQRNCRGSKYSNTKPHTFFEYWELVPKSSRLWRALHHE